MGESVEPIRRNSVHDFIDAYLKFDVESFVSKKEIYRVYIEYCKQKNIVPEPKHIFDLKLPQYIRAETNQIKIAGKRVKFWNGIRFITKPKGSIVIVLSSAEAIDALVHS